MTPPYIFSEKKSSPFAKDNDFFQTSLARKQLIDLIQQAGNDKDMVMFSLYSEVTQLRKQNQALTDEISQARELYRTSRSLQQLYTIIRGYKELKMELMTLKRTLVSYIETTHQEVQRLSLQLTRIADAHIEQRIAKYKYQQTVGAQITADIKDAMDTKME